MLNDAELKKELMGLNAGAWWVVFIRGLLLTVVGALALIYPFPTVLALVFVLGFFWLTDGIACLFGWFQGPLKGVPGIWFRIILNIVAGAFILSHPSLGLVAEVVLIWIAGSFSLVGGCVELYHAIKVWHKSDHPWSGALGSIMNIVFGVVLIISPVLSLFFVTLFIGAMAVALGIGMVYSSIKLKGMKA